MVTQTRGNPSHRRVPCKKDTSTLHGAHQICTLSRPKKKYFTDDEALGAAEALTWESIGSFERLRYLGRLLVHGPHIIFALLENSARSERDWTGMVTNDAIWLHSLVGNFYDLPPVQDGMTVLCKWMFDTPGKWAS